MSNSIRTMVWGLAAAALLSAAPAWAQAQMKVGVVDYARLMQESPQAKAVADAITNEFAPRQRELQTKQQALKEQEEKLRKDAATMSEEQRANAERALRDSARDLAREQAEWQDDLNARRNEELSRLQRTLIEQVQGYAKAQKYDLVLADGVIYHDAAIDITPAVLAALQAAKPAAAAAKPAGR